MDWEQIIKFLGGTTALTGLFAYLGKTTIESFLTGKLEAHKKNLEQIATENTIRFQQLHSERAEVVKVLYSKLVLLDGSLYSTLRRFQAVGEPSMVEKVNELANNYNSFREYFLPNKIFFEEPLSDKIDDIIEDAKGVFFDLTTHPVNTSELSSQYHQDVLDERHDFWEKARSIHENKTSSLKEELENEFRLILGIKKHNPMTQKGKPLMCDEKTTLKYKLEVVAVLVALATLIVGVYQYSIAQKWKRTVFAAKQIEKLYSDAKLRAGLRIFEWEYRDFPMPKEYRETYNETIIYHNWGKVEKALTADLNKNNYGQDSAIYLDILDRYFDFLEEVSHYEDINLFSINDLGNICYAANLIATNEYDTGQSVLKYLDENDYDGVPELIEKCKRQE